jgi:hypothetical protein
MLTVCEYNVPLEKDPFSLELPEWAKILTVQIHCGRPKIWAHVKSENPMKTRKFRLAKTGDLIGDAWDLMKYDYIGTFQLTDHSVYHLFEIIEE